MYENRILNFGSRFFGRIEASLLQTALDYVTYNEEMLALETLCEHISEYDVAITNGEYSEAMQLALEMGFNLDKGPFKHLESLRSQSEL